MSGMVVNLTKTLLVSLRDWCKRSIVDFTGSTCRSRSFNLSAGSPACEVQVMDIPSRDTLQPQCSGK